jgi:GNAT superfamily N-acetyltransferase
MIEKCVQEDFKRIWEVINDGAAAYKGIIPDDRWHVPYMSQEELKTQMEEGVQFWCYKENGEILGVMGIQYKGDVTLIRHAYVRSIHRNKGIGSKLLTHLVAASTVPILIGTWANVKWAIAFYEKHGYRLLPNSESEALLRKYWNIPLRQVETSVVLASPDWKSEN